MSSIEMMNGLCANRTRRHRGPADVKPMATLLKRGDPVPGDVAEELRNSARSSVGKQRSSARP